MSLVRTIVRVAALTAAIALIMVGNGVAVRGIAYGDYTMVALGVVIICVAGVVGYMSSNMRRGR